MLLLVVEDLEKCVGSGGVIFNVLLVVVEYLSVWVGFIVVIFDVLYLVWIFILYMG